MQILTRDEDKFSWNEQDCPDDWGISNCSRLELTSSNRAAVREPMLPLKSPAFQKNKGSKDFND